MNLRLSLVFASLLAASAARPAELEAPLAHIPLNDGHYKPVQLLKVSLPHEAKTTRLKSHLLRQMRTTPPLDSTTLPPQVALGMNHVPVLDQGPWGTCATFAAAAAIDAFYPLHPNQQVSELCNLQLGRTLKLPDANGGWDGSMGYVVLNQISQYGYLPTDWQKTHGCGGLTEYPVSSSKNNGTPMPLAEFTQFSIKTFTQANWKTLFREYRLSHLFDPADSNARLTLVKQEIAAGYRILIGTLVDPIEDNIGILGKYHGVTATWVLTDDMMDDIENDFVAGHALIITGYDDHACASYSDDSTGQTKTQCGLLTLRNSWGSQAGDKGEYYMTYDYFRNMTYESYRIGSAT